MQLEISEGSREVGNYLKHYDCVRMRVRATLMTDKTLWRILRYMCLEYDFAKLKI
jgi:hypothetical protein